MWWLLYLLVLGVIGEKTRCNNTTDCNHLTLNCQFATCGPNSTCVISPQPTSFQCRARSGECGTETFCDGKTFECPPEDFQEAGTLCRRASGPCGSEGVCSGTDGLCPQEEAKLGECATTTHPCGTNRSCDGIGFGCPPEKVAIVGTVCEEPASTCSLGRICNGVDLDCPEEVLAPRGMVCRHAEDECDVEEVCDGVTPTCPPDLKRDRAYSFRCGTSLFLCGPKTMKDRGIISGRELILGGFKLGPNRDITLLPWPSCLSQCLTYYCSNGKPLSTLVFADCVNGTWVGRKKMEEVDILLATFPICSDRMEMKSLASKGVIIGSKFIAIVIVMSLIWDFCE